MTNFERRFRLTRIPSVTYTRIIKIHQVYWRLGHDWSIRVRQEDAPTDFRQSITIKGPRRGADRPEIVAPIFKDMSEAEKQEHLPILTALMNSGQPYSIEKTRRSFTDEDGVLWDIDDFHGRHAGLLIAETRSRYEGEVNAVRWPAWVTLEVTPDPKYNNENLAYEDCAWVQEPF